MSSAAPQGGEPNSSGSPFAYPCPEPTWDEAFLPNGGARPAAERLVSTLEAIGVDEVRRRWDQARRLIRDNGVTYNVYGDPRGMDRPWELDPIPMVIGSQEWAGVARGLAQRAELLNRILSDLYGEQRLLQRGLVPPELVLESTGFLRPLHGAPLPGGVALHLSAADLARGPNGRFVVLADRTQAPSGAGYALENRIVVSRTLPEAFGECRVQRLAAFFRSMRDTLIALAPRSRENPRIVLLTAGPHNETYFEHAYLARYLGFALVEGEDLTVRERRVYLKTLGGLERVDVVLRRLDDAFADPLSLRADSSLGVAGLVHAVRAGNVAVVNTLGSGVIETPALLAFLPGLCRELLGEDLLLDNVPAWWCGDETSRRYVVEHLESLVVKPALPGKAFEPVFAGSLDRATLDDLRRRIEADPNAFVAEEQIELSTAPVWSGNRLEPRHVALRAYVTRAGDAYEVLPGGLTRVAPTPESLVVSMQRGAGSKDLWVLAEAEELHTVSLLRSPAQPIEIVRFGADLPSRVADNLFWLGRHMERAEATTRLVRSLLMRLADDSVGAAPELPALVRGLEVTHELIPGTLGTTGVRGGRRLDVRLAELLLAAEPPHTLRATVTSAHRAGSVVRDRLSGDLWRVIREIQSLLDDTGRRRAPVLSDTLELLSHLVLLFSAFSGLSFENLTHGPGFRFLDMGRRIERMHQVARLLRTLLVPAGAEDGRTLEALLEIADSIITYRTRYLGAIEPAPVLDLLLTDEINPRSIAFQLAALEAHVANLPATGRSSRPSEEARTVLRMLTTIRLADVHALVARDATGERKDLASLLADVEAAAPSFGDSLTRHYLTHSPPSRSYGLL